MSFWKTSFQWINKTRSLKSRSDISLYFTPNPVKCPRHISRVIFRSFPLISTFFYLSVFLQESHSHLQQIAVFQTFCGETKGSQCQRWKRQNLLNHFLPAVVTKISSTVTSQQDVIIFRITGHRKSVYVHTESELPKTAVFLGDIVRSSL